MSGALKPLIRMILHNSRSFQWSLQGFGMLRLYLSERMRLHVWDSRFTVPGVSAMHTHPWDFESTVVAGSITNRIYVASDKPARNSERYQVQAIKCGPGGGLCPDATPTEAWVRLAKSKTYAEGDSYREDAEQIHTTHPANGTVTLVERTFKADRDHACVYWPYGEQWVSAEPRPATADEVQVITGFALERWFGQEGNR